jgi:hypothetical protein
MPAVGHRSRTGKSQTMIANLYPTFSLERGPYLFSIPRSDRASVSPVKGREAGLDRCNDRLTMEHGKPTELD